MAQADTGVSPQKRDRHRGAGRWTRKPEIAILVWGTLVSACVYWLAQQWDARERAASTHERVHISAQALEATLRELIGDVRALAQYYDASEAVDAAELSRFVRPFLEQHPGLRALEWVPRVRAAQRAAFEAQARAEGLSDFAIRECPGGEPHPAGPRSDYFPVYRVAPLAENASALGLDQGCEPLRRAALERARDTGQPAASAPLVLGRDAEGQRSLMIFSPQFPAGLAGDTPQARRERLQGFAVGVLRVKDLMEAAIAELPLRGLDLVLRDAQAPGDAGLLHVHPSRARQSGETLDLAAFARDPRGREARLTVGGRTLALRGLPAPGTERAALVPGALLGLGLVASLALALLVRYRRAAAARLQESEIRYRALFEHMRDGLAYCRMLYEDDRPRDFLYLAANPAFCRLTGLKDVVGRRIGEILPGIRESNPEIFEIYGRVARGGEPERFETFVEPLGIWVSVSVYSPAQDRFVAIFDDIGPRREAEAALRASEERLRLATDAAQMGLFDWDLAERRILWSWHHERLWGFSPGEFDGTYESFAERVHPDDRARVHANIARCMAERSRLSHEFRVLWPDGSLHWIAGVGEFRLDAAGRPLRMYGTVLEITERKRAEETLRERETRLGLLIEHAPAALAMLDREMRYVAVSRRWRTDYGLGERDLIGCCHDDVFPEIPDAWRAIHRRGLDGERLRSQGDRFERADGSVQWVRWELCPWHDAAGQVAGIGIFTEDITELAQARAALESQQARLEELVAMRTAELQASEAKLRTIYDLVPVGISITDRSGFIVDCNKAAEELLDIAPATYPRQTFGSHMQGILRPDGTPMPPEEFACARALAEGRTLRDVEMGLVKPQGVSWVLVSAMPTPHPDYGVVIAYVEITDLKRAREQAEQAARTKAAFLAHMSHEIRTPMNGIIGLAELALHQPLAPAPRKYLDQIRQSSTSLMGILNDILDYSRIEAGRLRPESAPFDRDALLATLRALFAHAAAAKGLALVIEVAPEVPRFLQGDALRLQQVLSNLLGNAVKFTGQGRVSLRIASLGSGEGLVRLRFAVEDTGIGMDADTLARLFEPFAQGDGSIARRFGGTGLGLAISRDLLRLMGSDLKVESAVGRGSAFRFDLDLGLAAGRPSEVGTPPGSRAALAGAHVLVAEDQPVNRRVIGDMLRLLGIRVTLATHGREALERLSEATFDAVLMDVQMPEMDGLAATRRIRENPAWGGLPVIALTAGITEAERERTMACGMTDLLPKPVTLDSLTAALGRWIGRRAAPAPLPPPPADRESRVPDPGEALALPGFDLRSLQLSLGDASRASDLLRQLADETRSDADAIARAIAQGDLAEAGRLVHRLKGASGTLGATDLCAAAARLEADLQAGHAPNPALDSLRQAHAQALARIGGLPRSIPIAPGTAVPEGQPLAVRELAGEIRARLHAGLLVPRPLLAELASALPGSDRNLYLSLKDCLDRFDYGSADRVLEPLLSRSPETADQGAQS